MLVLESDRLWAELLGSAILQAWPDATLVTVPSVAEAALAIERGDIELLVTSLMATDGDAVDALLDWADAGSLASGVFVVTTRKEPVLMNALAGSPIRGVFDPATEYVADLHRACEVIADGGMYWSSSVRDAIAHTFSSPESVFRQLTFTEQLVLSLIGDGRDDSSAAAELGMTQKTVMTVRRNLHRKLKIQHKGELVRIAMWLGFVLITPHGIVRPGLKRMLSERQNRFRKRHTSARLASLPTWPVDRVA